jgi:serine/threonine-protein kinase
VEDAERDDDMEPIPADPTDAVGSTTTDDSLAAKAMADTVDMEYTNEAGTGRLAVRFSPWASVWIDGDSLTTTSVDTLDIKAGRHEVLLRNPDFPELRRELHIRANEVTRLEISLWSTVARLSIQVVPWAEVEIDGAVVDTIPPQARPLILAPGPHTLRLLHPEYGEIQRDVVLQAGEHRELAYNMREASRR